VKTINIFSRYYRNNDVISRCDTAIVIECYYKKYVVNIGLNLKHNGNTRIKNYS